jgi:hypothetical protein
VHCTQQSVQRVPDVPYLLMQRPWLQLNTHIHVMHRLRIIGVKPPFPIYSVTHSVPAYYMHSNDQSVYSVTVITQNNTVWLTFNSEVRWNIYLPHILTTYTYHTTLIQVTRLNMMNDYGIRNVSTQRTFSNSQTNASVQHNSPNVTVLM